MDNLLKIVQRGADNLLQVEEYLARVGVKTMTGPAKLAASAVPRLELHLKSGALARRRSRLQPFLLRQALQRSLPPGKFIEGQSGRAHDLGIVRHIFEDGAFGRDLDAIADLKVAGESALARHVHVIAQFGGASDADL